MKVIVIIFLFVLSALSKEEDTIPALSKMADDATFIVEFYEKKGKVIELNLDQSAAIKAILLSDGERIRFISPRIQSISYDKHGVHHHLAFPCAIGEIYVKNPREKDPKRFENVAFIGEGGIPLHLSLLDLFSARTKKAFIQEFNKFNIRPD